MLFSRTPGVPKSLVWLPIAITSVSYCTRTVQAVHAAEAETEMM